MGSRVLSPRLSSPDIADSFCRYAILECKNGSSASNPRPSQVVDVDGLLRCESVSVTMAAGSNNWTRLGERGWTSRRDARHALQRHAAGIRLHCSVLSRFFRRNTTVIREAQTEAALLTRLIALAAKKANCLERTDVVAEWINEGHASAHKFNGVKLRLKQ